MADNENILDGLVADTESGSDDENSRRTREWPEAPGQNSERQDSNDQNQLNGLEGQNQFVNLGEGLFDTLSDVERELEGSRASDENNGESLTNTESEEQGEGGRGGRPQEAPVVEGSVEGIAPLNTADGNSQTTHPSDGGVSISDGPDATDEGASGAIPNQAGFDTGSHEGESETQNSGNDSLPNEEAIFVPQQAEEAVLPGGIGMEVDPAGLSDAAALGQADENSAPESSIGAVDVNDTPVDISLSASSVNENASGAVVGTLSTTDVDDGDSHSYTVDDARFEVVGGQLKLKDGQSLDHETAETVTVNVTTTDSGGLTRTEAFDISVADVNEVARDISLSASSVNENAAGAVVGTLSTTDVDDRDTHTYAVDDGRFEVVDGQLKLKDGQSLDHETAETVTVNVTTTDSGGLTHDEDFTISIADVNEAPVDIALSAASVAENLAGGVIGTVSGTDPDAGDSLTYTVDDARFEVVGGQLKLKDGQSLDHETADSLTLTVTATDSGGLTHDEDFTISIADVNEAPVDMALSAASVAENLAGGVIGTVSGTDPDSGDSLTYTVDDARFEVVGGQLKLKAGQLLDAEIEPTVAVEIAATDSGGLTYTETFNISVSDVNEGPTDITFTGGSVQETVTSAGTIGAVNDPSGSTVATLSAVDADSGESFTYSLTGDASGKFEIVGNEVRVKSGQTVDFETDTSFDLTIEVTDSGGNTYSETISIGVQDYAGAHVSVAPSETITGTSEEDIITALSGANTIDAGAGDDVVTGGLNADTIDGGAGDDVIDGGAGWDTIDGGAGADTLTGGLGTDTLDYGDSSGGVTVDLGANTATGGDATGDTISGFERVAGSDQDDSLTGSSDDNKLWGMDGDDTLTGGAGDDEIFAGAGDDTVVFSGNWADYTIVQGGAGEVTITDNRSGSPDGVDIVHNAENFQFADGAVSAADLLNDAPADISSSGNTIAENAATGAVVATLSATDADSGIASESATFSITNDPSGNFEIVGNEVRVKAGASLDFETDTSHDITVQVTDAHGATYSESVTITVTDTGQTGISLSASTVSENWHDVVIGNLSATDDAGRTQTWTVDDNRFEVVGGQLKLKEGQSLNHESEPTVDLEITATNDQGETYTETMTITVTDIYERPAGMVLTAATPAPVDSDDQSPRVAENSDGAVIGTITTFDVDDGDTHTYAVDDSRFEVVGNQIKLKSGQSLDYETESSIDLNITATDAGGRTVTQQFSVNVTDVSESTNYVFGSGNAETVTGTSGDDTIYGIGANAVTTGSNLIANGSFEANGGGVSGWSNTGNTNAQVKTNGQHGVNSSDGSRYVDMDNSPGNATLEQSVSGLTDGKSYRLSFDAADYESSYGFDASLEVYWNGELIDTVEPGTTNMQTYSYTVEGGAGDGSDTLEFREVGTVDYGGTALDNVELYELITEDTINAGAGDDIIHASTGAESFDGGDGIDTVNYSGSASAVGVNLDTGRGAGGAAGDSFANIEQVVGSSYDDVVYGSDTGTTASLGAGNDTFNNDTGTGSQVDNVSGGAGNDQIRTGDDDDIISGGTGNDTLYGEAGDDLIIGGSGADTMDGGSGTDTLSYAGSSAGVTVDMGLGTALGGDATGDSFSNTTDSFTNFENLTGSDNADILTGDGNVNVIDGGAGNDTINGGAGDDTLIGGSGSDILSGGSGSDTASYESSSAAVTVNLNAGTSSGGDAEGDTFSSIENLAGSEHNDTLTGDSSANVLTGGAGNDTLRGYGGSDVLNGGSGSDILIVGDQGGGTVTVDGGSGWVDTLQLQNNDSSNVSDGWTINLTSGTVHSNDGGTMQLSDDAAGSITLDDGTTINFQNIEVIDY